MQTNAAAAGNRNEITFSGASEKLYRKISIVSRARQPLINTYYKP